MWLPFLIKHQFGPFAWADKEKIQPLSNIATTKFFVLNSKPMHVG
jgi:hypothetical protein